MDEFERHEWRGADDAPSDSGWTIRMAIVRLVAGLILVSFLGSFYVAFRGIDGILVVIGVLVGAVVVVAIAKKQRDAENPYAGDDPVDYDLH